MFVIKSSHPKIYEPAFAREKKKKETEILGK